jgi:centromeric protein E
MDAVKQERLRRSLSGASSSSSDAAARHGSPGSSVAAAAAAAKKERVWVGVRIRPQLEPELLARERTAWRAVRSDTLQYLGGGGDPERAPGQQGAAYTYSRVFPETASSDDVYADTAAGLLAAAVRGYNGTVFAYGQTGSGKTHTMGGLMAAAAADVFALISAQPGREFIIRLAALEIYNENVRDLLQDRSPALKLLDDPQRGTVADGLSEAGVSSQAHLQQLLREVAARRQVRACVWLRCACAPAVVAAAAGGAITAAAATSDSTAAAATPHTNTCVCLCRRVRRA